MLIVGELINTSRKAVKTAVDTGDAAAIQEIARNEAEAGAHYIDVNCGTMISKEEQMMEWLVKVVQERVTDTPLCIDSPNCRALQAGLKLHRNGQPMINSITAQEERFSQVIPLVLEYKAKVVALLMDDAGMPDTYERRKEITDRLIPRLIKDGVPAGDIYVDPLIKPISTGTDAGQEVLQTLAYIGHEYPDVHTICGLSNISFGLPNRRVLNRIFCIETMTMGMDSFILDPLDKKLVGDIYAGAALLGKDNGISESAPEGPVRRRLNDLGTIPGMGSLV